MLEQIDRYEIRGLLGRGGMADVYLAFDPQVKREVAIKLLHQARWEETEARVRFQREVEAVVALKHPNIVVIHDFLPDADPPYLVMQYMEGGSLASLLEHGPLSLPQAVQIVARIAAALDEAHLKGLVHRDLKPANILFDSWGNAYLADFGIVKIRHADTTLTSKIAIGTPVYMSPEQVRGEKSIDGRSDVYSLGVMLFEMLTGRLPFAGNNLYGNQNDAPVPNVSEVRPELPFECHFVIKRALARRAEDRYATAGEMVAELQSLVLGGEVAEPLHINGTLHTGTAVPIPPSRPTLAERISDTTHRISHQIKLIPLWLRLTIAGLTAVFLFILLRAEALSSNRSGLESTATRIILSHEAVTEVAGTPSPVSSGSIITLIKWGDDAIWQQNDTLQRIPVDGLLPITTTRQTFLLQTARDSMEMLLPDRTKLFLDADTAIRVRRLVGLSGGTETNIVLEQGRLIVTPSGAPVTIASPDSAQVESSMGLIGVEYSSASQHLYVDCLQGECLLLRSGVRVLEMNVGEQAAIDEGGFVTVLGGARYELYQALANVVPPPTNTPTLTPSATATATETPLPMTPTLTSTPMAIAIPGQRVVLGYSVQNRPIEAVRFGYGNGRIFVFIGGLQAGYAPNSMDLAEGFVTYFSENPTAVPADTTLYIIPDMSPDSLILPGQLEGRYNANGVELNRNWGCRWSEDPLVMSRVRPGAGGAFPFSEPETRVVATFIQSIEPTAVIFWTAHADSALVSPGACVEQSQVSLTLSQLYGRAAGYEVFDGPVVLPNVDLTGDAVNFLDYQGIPAAVVLLPHFLEMDWDENLAGVTAVLASYRGTRRSSALPFVNTADVPTPLAACSPTAERWQSVYTQYEYTLGCAVGALVAPEAAVQQYEHGWMIWRGDNDYVYVLYDDYTMASFLMDEYDPYEWTDLHKGAFGYIWLNQADVRAHLGEPLAAEEVAHDFVAQDFANGSILFLSNNGINYVLFAATMTWDAES
ncbi:MAG: protein kinase [Ardenticatenaceae bacterium]|nr:protein kinase [Ardenticatenaceae bacterium]